MPRSFRLPGLLAALVMSTANAAGPLLLEAAQVKALGIETAVAGEVGKLRQGAYPARVLVPCVVMRTRPSAPTSTPSGLAARVTVCEMISSSRSTTLSVELPLLVT